MINMVSPLISLILTLLLPQFLLATPQLAAIIFLASVGLGLIIAIPAQTGWMDRPGNFTRWAMARAALRQYSVYPKYTLPLSLSSSVTERVTQLVLAQAYSLGTLASFYMARQLLSGITSVIAGSLRNVFFAHSSWDNSISETRNRALNMLKLLTYLLAPALAFAVFRIEDVVQFLAGDKWPSLAPMAWLCMFPATILIFTGPLDRVFDLVGRQRLSVILQLASDVVMLVSIAVAVHFSVPSQTLAAIISLVLTVYNAIWLCFTLQSLSVSATEVVRVFVRFAVCFAVCVVLQWPLIYLGSKTLSWMIALLVVGFLVAPGIIALSNSIPLFRSRISPGLSGLLARLP
jgi:O-antigen/teichoic acid export membrane protein